MQRMTQREQKRCSLSSFFISSHFENDTVVGRLSVDISFQQLTVGVKTTDQATVSTQHIRAAVPIRLT
jgi:hypothetical protein